MISLIDVSLKGRVHRMTLSLKPGELFVLLGPNGAGKSSVLSLLSGFVAPDSGAVTLDDIPLADFSTQMLSQRRAVLEQRVALPSGFKVRALIEMGAYRHGQQSAVEKALSLIDSEDLLDRHSETLSGGEAQRVLLTRALAQLLTEEKQERYLLLDEPTASLDIGASDAILSKVQWIAHSFGVGVLVILHDINLALRYADRIGLMRQMKLHAIGDTATVMTVGELEALYQTPLTELTDPNGSSIKAFVARGSAS